MATRTVRVRNTLTDEVVSVPETYPAVFAHFEVLPDQEDPGDPAAAPAFHGASPAGL